MRFCVTTLFATALFFAGSQPAMAAIDAYMKAINAAVQTLQPGTSSSNCTQLTLEKATLQCIKNDVAKNVNNAANYANAALVGRADRLTIAASYAQDVASQVLGGIKVSATTLQTSMAQGAIKAAPTLAGAIAASVLYSSTNIVPIATTAAGTWAYAYTLGKTSWITNNTAAIQQIATAIGSNTNPAFYPVITDPNGYSNDPLIQLAVRLMQASPKSAYNIAYGIGQSLSLDTFAPTGTSLPSYDQRERLARYASWLAASLPSNIDAAAVAEGLITANPEVAPRVLNEMLLRNPGIAKSPDKFIQTVSSVIKTLDTGDILEIAAAITFGNGIQNLSPGATQFPTDTLAPYLSGSANANKFASALATVFSKQIVIQTGTAPTNAHNAEIANDLAVMEGILANKLSSIVVAQGLTAKSMSTYQTLILTIASAANNAAKTAKLPLAQQQAIANEVAQYVSEAIKTVYTAYLPTDPAKKNIYYLLITNLNKIVYSKTDPTFTVATSVNSGYTGADFAWGTLTLTPDETPNTNF